MNTKNTRRLVVCAMVAALYTTLCVATAPISYGMIQIRSAEALTLLPIFSPVLIWGVTLGCALSNLVGFMTGANILGFLDILFGTAATLCGAWMTWKLRNVRTGKLPIAAAIPPVLVNALVIGLELMWLETNAFVMPVFLINALYVGLGQAIACFGLGIPLTVILERTGLARRYLQNQEGSPNSGDDNTQVG